MVAISPPECITQKSRLYALKELARRAGVTPEFFQTWRIDLSDTELRVCMDPGSEKQIRFPCAPSPSPAEATSDTVNTAKAGWMHAPAAHLGKLVPDFIVPFVSSHQVNGCPLFQALDNNTVECSLDLLASALLTLSRFEETHASERDAHGRFAASSSVSIREGFLDRPIVDEYGLALREVLQHLLPSWEPAQRPFAVKLSHDIDSTGHPANRRAAIGHTLHRRKPLATARDVMSWLLPVEPTYLHLVRSAAQMSLDRGLDSAVYWMASEPCATDSGYDPCHEQVQRVVTWLREQGVELGVHPGYHTYLSPEHLFAQVAKARQALGEPLVGGRQHFLRWSPETWVHWENCGLAYDSTLGYADRIGFRAGTCVPYRPWLLSLDREADLLEIPLLVMDCTLVWPQYMGLTIEQSLNAVMGLVERCRAVGGVFTLLWHNASLIEPAYGDLYERILDQLAGSSKYDWKAELNDRFPLPALV